MDNNIIFGRKAIWPDITAGFLALSITVGGIVLSRDSSWFTMMLLFSIHISVRRGVWCGFAAALPSIAGTFTLHVFVWNKPIILEVVFVFAVWIIMVFLTGKLAELTQRSRKLAEEKKILLREVNHRMKNHMNIIRSIITLERAQCMDSPFQDKLLDLENRIALMQHIYQRLHDENRESSISLRLYMEELCDNLQRVLAPHSRIKVKYLVEDMLVPSQQALPLGLVVNELVTNAFKHAFVGKDEGIITLTMRRENDTTLYLELTDNGNGLKQGYSVPEDFGFGLTLVEGYVKQYDGELDINGKDGGGTVWSARLSLAG